LVGVAKRSGANRFAGKIPFQRFDAWKRAHQLALDVYHVSDGWPRSERYESTTQVRRACLSVPTNLAEGIAKRGSRELRRYLEIGDCFQLATGSSG